MTRRHTKATKGISFMPFVTEVRGDTAFVRLPLPLIVDPHVERGVVRIA